MSSEDEVVGPLRDLIFDPKPVTRTTTHSSSDSDESDSLNDVDPPSISHIYTNANQYEKVLSYTGCIQSRRSDADGANGFHDLVEKDLDSSEQVIASRFTKLRVAGETWIPGDLTAEPDSYEADKDDESSSDDSVDNIESKGPVLHRAATSDGDSWKLEPDEIIPLLIEEFGPLAEEGEEEKLILETDGCLIQDVIIVGVIHLTTHRITFHASLLATQPDIRPAQQVIKSGPVTIHRPGWHAKRRVWMELSPDFLCSYSSSNDKDRIRPLRSVLLSSIKDVHPIDPKKPRYIRVIFINAPGMDGIAELDTEESAQDWRKELLGALYVYRHRRRAALDAPSGDTDEGIRLSCALDRITQGERKACPNFSHIVSLHVQLSQSDEDELGVKESRVFQIGPLQPFPAWTQLGVHIAAAKDRRRLKPATVESTVFLDFGELNPEANNQGLVKSSDTQGNKEKTIRSILALGAEPELWFVRARIFRSISCTGYFVVSPNYVSFWSKSHTRNDIRYRLAVSTIRLPKPFRSKLVYGLALELEALPDLRFQFKSAELRDDAIRRVNDILEAGRAMSPLSSSGTSTPSTTATSSTLVSPSRSTTGIFAPASRSLAAAIAMAIPEEVQLRMPKAINLPREILASRPSLHFMCLTIGSRGDVQPYIALGLGLKKEGHRVTIVTHDEYKPWIEGFGIEHRQAGGDPGALMKLSVENKMFSPDFFKESLTNFRPWLDQLLLDSWESCKDADVLLESPSAMAGVHIAEALNIPYFRTFTMPWTKTAEFPHAFLSPPVDAPTFNSASYVLFSNVMWTATSGQINKWRRHTLNIGNTDMGHLAQSKITFIYNFSHAVVPKPLDWGDTTIISGYWFLDNPDLGWTPPADLIEWMAKARKDGKPIVYIGFGSITVPRPNRVTARIIKAVLKSDVRAIISKGWSARMSKGSDKDPAPEIPPQCYQLDKVPHDWLFPQIDAAVHHGGAGTTGASLRAGIPTLIKPWFGDQWFWASRVEKLGAGLKVPSLHSHHLAPALIKATSSRVMKEKAAAVGERIRSEDGVHRAIHTIYTYLGRASRNRAHLDRN